MRSGLRGRNRGKQAKKKLDTRLKWGFDPIKECFLSGDI